MHFFLDRNECARRNSSVHSRPITGRASISGVSSRVNICRRENHGIQFLMISLSRILTGESLTNGSDVKESWNFISRKAHSRANLALAQFPPIVTTKVRERISRNYTMRNAHTFAASARITDHSDYLPFQAADRYAVYSKACSFFLTMLFVINTT